MAFVIPTLKRPAMVWEAHNILAAPNEEPRYMIFIIYEISVTIRLEKNFGLPSAFADHGPFYLFM